MACLSFTTFNRSGYIRKAAARRGRAAAFVALLAALLTLLLAGCGRGGVGYTAARYGFALTYDASLTRSDQVTPAVSGAERPAYVVAFLDAAAPRIEGRYVDGLWVAVLRLSAGAHWPAPSAMAAGLRSRLAAAVADLHGSVTPAPARTIATRPATGFGYDYRLGGTAVRAITYVIVKGEYEYQVTLQSAAARWATMLPRLARSLDSFSLR